MKSSADHAHLALLLSHPPEVLKYYKDITPSSELVESTNASMPDATKRSGVDLKRLASGIAIVTSTGQYFATIPQYRLMQGGWVDEDYFRRNNDPLNAAMLCPKISVCWRSPTWQKPSKLLWLSMTCTLDAGGTPSKPHPRYVLTRTTRFPTNRD